MKNITRRYIAAFLAIMCLVSLCPISNTGYASDNSSSKYECYENSPIPTFDSVITHKNVSKQLFKEPENIIKTYTYNLASDTDSEIYKNDLASYEKLLEENGWKANTHKEKVNDIEIIYKYRDKFNVSFDIIANIVSNNKVRKLRVTIKYPKNLTLVYNSDGETAFINGSDLGVFKKAGWYNFPVVTMRNARGLTKIVPKDNLKEFEKLGWVDITSKTKIYNVYGKEKTVITADLNTYLSDGWYINPVTTIYSSSGESKIVPSEKLDQWKNSGWYDNSEPLVKMYSSDGSKFFLAPESEVKEWEDKGWINEYRKATIYSPNGDKSTILAYQLQSYKNVGWFDYPVTTVHAPDGRSHVVAIADVSAWENVGWIDGRKTVAIYSPDGNSATVPLYQLQSYKNVGWYDYPVTIMYALDGRTVVINKLEESAYKNNGWYTKTEYNKYLITALRYDTSKTGSLTGVITYQYNDFVGTKADVGADVMLVQTNHVPQETDDGIFTVFLADSAFPGDDPTIYSTEVDGMGNYYFDDIPAGEYYILIRSKNTNMSPQKAQWVYGWISDYLQNKISPEALETLSLWVHTQSHQISTVNILPNKTARFSHDFGNTYR